MSVISRIIPTEKTSKLSGTANSRNSFHELARSKFYQVAITSQYLFFQELRKHNVCTVVRVCEPSYDTSPLKAEGIEVRDLAYDDGTFPPTNVVEDWFEILREK